MFNFIAKLSNNEIINEPISILYWNKLRNKLINNNLKIIELQISSPAGSATIDKNSDGYFIGNKAVAVLFRSSSVRYIGIGYYRTIDDIVRIKWYNENMELQFVETKKPDDCGEFLIKNL